MNFHIGNHLLSRTLNYTQSLGLSTSSLINHQTGSEFAQEKPGCEFLIGINGKTFFGYQKPTVHILDGEIRKSESLLQFSHADESPGHLTLTFSIPEMDALLHVCYQVDKEAPGLSKWIELSAGSMELSVDKCFFEVIHAYPGSIDDLEFSTRYGLHQVNPMFVTQGHDDIIQIHNHSSHEGYFLCNEAPGPLNRFLVYPNWPDTAFAVGYTTDSVPFRCNLKPGDRLISHRSHLLLYQGEPSSASIRNSLRGFLRRQLPAYRRDDFMYCTWLPFLKQIDEPLLLDLAEQAAKLGVTTFVVDDGWFTDREWAVDKEKFPNGLEPISNRVRELGMRFGLWFNIGNSYGNTDQHVDDFSLDSSGQPKLAGFNQKCPCLCLASAHRERMIDKLDELAGQYDVGYFKLDFSTIVSPYGLLGPGCHSRQHQHHRDGEDAIFEQYSSMRLIGQTLQIKHPELIIDFSFESFGSEWPSLSALQYSGLHHCSNINNQAGSNATPLVIRNTLYRYATVLPNERMLGSLICLKPEDCVESLLTAMILAPLFAGDLRKLSENDCARIQRITNKISELSATGPLTEFVMLRQHTPIQRSQWDGYARLNRENHGYIAVFRNECNETPSIQIQMVDEAKDYRLVDILGKRPPILCTGASLHAGLEIPFEEQSILAFELVESER